MTTIEQTRSSNGDNSKEQLPEDAHTQLARAQSALHQTRLGFARWSSGNTLAQMEIASALMPTAQVRWHARSQKNFISWLERGGFSAPAPALDAEQPAAAAPEPQAGSANVRDLIA